MATASEPRCPIIEPAPTPYTHHGAVLPQKLRNALDLYARHGVPTGGFLRAVLNNDLFESVGRADHQSLKALPVICCYIHNCLPGNCWGSADKVQTHIDHWLPISQEQGLS